VSSDDEKYLTPNNVAEKTSRQSDHAAWLLTDTPLDLNSPPELPKNRDQNNANVND